MKAIIFGISGQDGYYLSKLLQTKSIEVLGVSRSHGDIKGDVADYSFVEQMIKEHKPYYIFHFAANSTTSHSALFENHNSISTGTLNILESVRIHCPAAKVFLSGSAMQFKNEELPINEQTPFEANSPYSVSRIQSVYAGRYYRSAFDLKVYVGYFFNHDSPLRSERHVNQKIVSSVKRIANGSDEKLILGNIDVKKEFNYAGDVVEAVWTLVNQDTVFEAIIGSGIAYSIREWVEYCFKKVNIDWKEHVIIEQDFIPEYKILVSNPELIRSIGWRQKVDFHKLADIMMEAQ
nr:GDP-mannose 4,6-dehydratase [uncultured Methanolobus sp.]